ncbi:hypothetical protein FHW69_000941 [Luteibacter sp. Sphag1AF]|uniref:hypothetical protein n=1 Tax=Luteibacter sp. Sphag1AF TaxID=2587031 RepID=UPI0016144B43|nr:hypothetical protein [Luteibacter sp. Sphag1AF]MBB3226351.1 hypothetical protein [Luteibacter sp. Sphag1AF]
MSVAWQSRPKESHLLHFSLPKVEESHELTLNVCLQRFPLKPHTEATRLAARAKHGFLRHATNDDLTHYIEVELPGDAVALMEVTRVVLVNGLPAEKTVHLGIHLPRSGLRNAVQTIREQPGTEMESHPKLIRLAKLLANDAHVDDAEPEDLALWQTPYECAASLLFQHPDIIYLDAKNGTDDKPGYIMERCIRKALMRTGELIEIISMLGDDWVDTQVAKGPDDKPLVDAAGNPVYTRVLHPEVQAALRAPLAYAIKLIKSDNVLRDVKWSLQYGTTTDTYGASADDGLAPHQALLASDSSAVAAGPYKWSLANRTPGSGLSVNPSLEFKPATQQKVFNTTDIWLNSEPGKAALSPEAVKELLAGGMFVSLCTPEHPSGILRAQLLPRGPVVDGKEVEFDAVFSGDAAVPPVSSKASATGRFKLNDLRTALTFSIAARELGPSPTGMLGIGIPGQRDKDVRPFPIADDSAYGTLTLTCTNEWLRHLSACVRYLDESGKVITPTNWSEKIPSGLRSLFQQDDNTKFLDLVPPVRTVFAIPVPPDPTRISIPVPADARSVQIYFGGLGSGGSYDGAVCPVGFALTVVMEMAVPMILLVAGTAVTNSKTVVELVANTEVLFAVCTVAAFLVAGGSAAYIGTSQDPMIAVKNCAITLGPMLLSPATALGQYLLKEYAAGMAARAVPFLNVLTTVVSGAVTAAQLAQTSIEVASSPWVFNAEITRAIDLDVTLVPDHNFHRFPDVATSYSVAVVYDKGATLPKQEFQLRNGPPWSKPIKVMFKDIPAGGRLKVYVFFYAANGWQAGQGESGWIDARGTKDATLVINGLEITTNEVPLTKDSVYTHASKIAYDQARGGHYWHAVKVSPDATSATAPTDPKKSIQRLMSITTAQRPAMMAYAWQATGLNVPLDDASATPVNQSMYTLQNLSTLEDPDSAYATPAVGFNSPPGVFYDVASPQNGTGRNFFADSTRGDFDAVRNPAGGMHIRRVALTYRGQPPAFKTRSNESWGRFPMAMDRYILHPQGAVIGINYSTHKIYILQLPTAHTTDDKAPLATMASGEGLREGMLSGPRAIATGLDGRVLILESGNNRIQAFDLQGKPVAYFKDAKSGQKTSIMALRDSENSTYLDLAVEAKGYLYVLRCRSPVRPENYMVDLYQPDGTFLTSTPRVTADKITVDLLRNMFSLNYEVIYGKDGRPEPSVSLWIPPAPSAS